MKPWLFRLVGVAVFVYLLVGVVGVRELGEDLLAIPLTTFLLIVPLHLSQWWLRTLRLNRVLQRHEIHIPLLDNLSLSLAAFLLGCMTPGRLGEFGKVKFLMNGGASFRQAFLSALIERLLDVATLMLFVAGAALVCMRILPSDAWRLVVFALAGVGVLVGLVFARRLIAIVLRKLVPERLAGSLEDKGRIFMDSLRCFSPGDWMYIAVTSLGVWGLNYVMIYLLFLGTGNSIPLLFAIAFASLGSLAGLIPLSIYGSGIREGMLIPLFLALPDPPPDAQGAAFTFGFMFLVVLLYHIALGWLAWMSPWMRSYVRSGSADSVSSD